MQKPGMKFGGVFEAADIKALALKLMELYDTEKSGFIKSSDIGCLITDSYRAQNKSFNPTQQDIEGGMKIFNSINEQENDKISLAELEAQVMKYFLGSPPPAPIQNVRVTNKQALERLEVARRIFRSVDMQKVGYLTSVEARLLLIETQKIMGINSSDPSEEDVEQWIEMTDSDGDGKVTLDDYEQLVMRSLIQQGIKLD